MFAWAEALCGAGGEILIGSGKTPLYAASTGQERPRMVSHASRLWRDGLEFDQRKELYMSDETANIMIEHLKALRSELAAFKAEVHQDHDDIKQRLTSIERGSLRAREDTTQVQEDVYRQQASIDALTKRIERIEGRLELS
jgi:septal ring factor EnvC (AmiA/AmiB activator)